MLVKGCDQWRRKSGRFVDSISLGFAGWSGADLKMKNTRKQLAVRGNRDEWVEDWGVGGVEKKIHFPLYYLAAYYKKPIFSRKVNRGDVGLSYVGNDSSLTIYKGK